ncbi:peptidoglycan recognition protein family protein [Streptomyces globisporus]|uniref:peptidoglycan recognition protein family protein n=1 Tax=Streptomyces globisporus TaxID=1908 RepID=UPI00386F22A7|nr:peptidoglycan recognition protein family protein [Streptomyces globisporus]
MKLVTRSQLGWPASAAPSQSSAKGVKVHYEGTAVSTKLLTDHDACLDEWKNIRRSHLANTAENYSDVAYNYAACPHGYLLEGRGLRRRTGANGNQALNQAHYAILGLVGSSGLTEPPDLMLSAIRDGIDLMRKNGAGAEIKGHRDGYATACPGGPLYAWVQKGAPRPATPTPPKEAPVALSDADVKRIAKACADEVWKVMAKSDGVYLAPTDDPQYSAEPTHPGHYWSGRTVMADLVRRARDTQKLVAELVAAQKKES